MKKGDIIKDILIVEVHVLLQVSMEPLLFFQMGMVSEESVNSV